MEFHYDNVSFSMTSFLSRVVVKDCQTKHDSFAMNSPISTVLNVECFLEVILLICRFKMVKFPFENGTLESRTCYKQYGAKFNPFLINRSNDALTSHR